LEGRTIVLGSYFPVCGRVDLCSREQKGSSKAKKKQQLASELGTLLSYAFNSIFQKLLSCDKFKLLKLLLEK